MNTNEQGHAGFDGVQMSTFEAGLPNSNSVKPTPTFDMSIQLHSICIIQTVSSTINLHLGLNPGQENINNGAQA